MEIKFIEDQETHVSEKGLITWLSGKELQTKEKPQPNLVLAQKATDFWVKEWSIRGVEILSAELTREFDPEEDYYYFLVNLTCKNLESVHSFVEKEFEIIDVMAEDENNYEWMDLVVHTSRVGD